MQQKALPPFPVQQCTRDQGVFRNREGSRSIDGSPRLFPDRGADADDRYSPCRLRRPAMTVRITAQHKSAIAIPTVRGSCRDGGRHRCHAMSLARSVTQRNSTNQCHPRRPEPRPGAAFRTRMPTQNRTSPVSCPVSRSVAPAGRCAVTAPCPSARGMRPQNHAPYVRVAVCAAQDAGRHARARAPVGADSHCYQP